MTLKRPLWMQAAEGDAEITYSALEYRLLISSLLSQGVVGVGDLAVTQRAAGANFSVDVAPGTVVIAGTSVDEQGSYLCRSDGVENLVIPDPPGTGSRTHRVVARVYDHLHDSGTADYEWTPEVLEDTGSGTPATPDSAVSLALVTVAAGQSDVEDNDIDDDRPLAAAGGGGAKKTALLQAADELSITSATTGATFVNTGLRVDLDAARKYEIRATIIYSAGAGDIKLDLTGPTGFGCDLTAFGLGTTAVATEGDLKGQLLLASPDFTAFGGAGVGTKVTAYLHGHLYSGVGGDITIRIGQLAANAAATALYAQSLLIADPFA